MQQNVTESIKVPASLVVDGLKALPDETKRKLLAHASYSGESPDSVITELAELLPEAMRKELDNVGAKLPTDTIEIKMTLGEFLFATYIQNVVPVKAPLPIRRHEKRLMELADLFDQPEFEVPSDVKIVLDDVLNVPEKWSALRVSAFVVTSPFNKPIVLTAAGAAMFSSVVAAAVDICA
jgi:hypothetical protein